MNYALSRVAGIVPTLFVICTLGFFVVRLAPGGPFDDTQTLPAQVRANLEHVYGLDQPLIQQYLRYMSGVAHGDFGPSLRMRDVQIRDLLAAGLPLSLTLGAAAVALAILAGIPLGVRAAYRPRGLCDRAAAILAAAVLGIPNFVLAPLLTLLLGVYLHWLPVAGWSGRARELVLPVLVLALPIAATLAQLARAGTLDVLRQPWLRTAHAKGLTPRRILLHHVLPPALLPSVSYLGPAVAFALTGSLVVETLFGLPGTGRYLVEGAINRDYPLVMGMIIVYGTLTLLCNLAADLFLAWLDPRTHEP